MYNSSNYFKSTKVNYTHIFAAGTTYTRGDITIVFEDADKVWADLLVKYADKIKNSPLSDSCYIVLEDRVYRKADHWGRCASCYWDLCKDKNTQYPEGFRWGSYSVGVAYFSDFEHCN